MKRPYGSGTVEPYRGKFRARAPRLPDGRRPIIGSDFETEVEAARACDEHALTLAEAGLASGTTFRVWGDRYLDRRELGGARNIASDRSRWKLHIATAHFADWPLVNIARRDVKDWLARLTQQQASDVRAKDPKKRKAVYLRKPRKIGAQTRLHCLNLIRKAFDEAVDDELISVNPAKGIKPPKVEKADYDYLHIEEQHAIERCTAVPEADRLRAMFAWGTGIRQFDQWAMKLEDLRLEREDPDMIIWCHKLQRKIRVPLFGIALRAVKRWLELLPEYCTENERGLVWPLPSGAQRAKSKAYGWANVLKAAGVKRHVTWHELRDTCGSSLIAGWWGEPWTLLQVKEMLHHSTIEVTERYAHLAPAVLDAKARVTTGVGPQLVINARSLNTEKPSNSAERATQESNLRPSASEAPGKSGSHAALAPLGDQLRTNAEAVIRAQCAGDLTAATRLALDLATLVIQALDAGEASTERSVPCAV